MLLQTRGIGENALANAPDVLVFLFGLLTQLGDQWFYFLVFTSMYWLARPRLTKRPRQVAATFVGLAFASLALVTALKVGFALPRPPTAAIPAAPAWPTPLADLFVSFTTDDGFGFPSGHALGATVVYGAAAVMLDIWDRRRRVVAAAVIVGLVALSRVVIGVHYGIDVVVGVLLGLGLLKVLFTVAVDEETGLLDPARVFGLSAVLGLVALGTVLAFGGPGHTEHAAAALGGSLGGFVGWTRLSDHESLPTLSFPVAFGALAVAGGLWGGLDALDAPLPLMVVGTAVVVAFILVAPQLQGALGSSQVASNAD
ncbi:phosphatase PAP2 family protein [Haloferax sp. DFSO60]|uniref:phosphatase PAP2 family protein n=1 Tax=Haloferax sp. DFSO60 TaxID=3388652 RepID=UPI003978A5D3